MATTKKPPVSIEEIGFDSYPPGVYLPEGGVFTGIFRRLVQGPENEYGTPWIVEFEAEKEDHMLMRGDVPVVLTPGDMFSYWLTSTTLTQGFRKAAPTPGERFAVKNNGLRTSRARRDKDGGPVQYHEMLVVMPDRPPAVRESLSWDAIPAE